MECLTASVSHDRSEHQALRRFNAQPCCSPNGAVRRTGSEPMAIAEQPPSRSRPDRRRADRGSMRTIYFGPSPLRGRRTCVRMVRRFMPLAKSLALRYRRRTESLDDLMQVASLGLVKSINRFDPGLDPRSRPTPRRRSSASSDAISRSRLEPSAAARPAGADDEDRPCDRRSRRGARAPSDPDRDRGRLNVTVEDVLDGIEAIHARRTRRSTPPVRRTRGR